MPVSIGKRQRERSRQERQREKEIRRQERKAEKAARPAVADGEDPDLAGIVAGPQPLPPEDT